MRRKNKLKLTMYVVKGKLKCRLGTKKGMVCPRTAQELINYTK